MNYLSKKIIIFFFVIVSVVTVSSVFYLGETESQIRQTYNNKLESLNGLFRNLGYGGVIHSFKNYVLRGEIKYYESSKKSLDKAETLISNYFKNFKLQASEKESFESVLEVIKQYRSNLEIVGSEIAKGVSLGSEIDKMVRVDDKDALEGILRLIKLFEKKKIQVESKVEAQRLLICMFLAFLFIVNFILHYKELGVLEKKNQELEIVNEELLQFTYRTSHDLKAPLVSIRGLAEFIEEDLDSNQLEEVKKNIKKIKSLSRKIEILVIDLLSMARMDLAELNQEPLRITEVVDDIEISHKHLSEQNKVKVIKNITLTREHLGYRTSVMQILPNLMMNSIKYFEPSREKRLVEITITDSNNHLIIEVKDNGTGIPGENKEDIYKMFKRFHTNNSLGSGLGMYMVKKSVERMRGTIDYETSNTGTIFRVVLPTS